MSFIRIGEERFKEASISRYKYEGQSSTNKLWYISIWFGQKEKKFSFQLENQALDVVKYLDKVLSVKEI